MPPDASQPTSAGLFRCVCGHDVHVDAQAGTRCDQCDRFYPPGVVSPRSLAETTCYVSASPARVPTREDQEKLVGRTLGHFEILRVLGQGGMGTVYYAVDLSLQRYVAIKVIAPTGEDRLDRDLREAVLQEARLQARVNHPNIVTVYYVATNEELPYFAMEYVAGPSLAQRLKQGTIPFRPLIRIAIQLTEALQDTAAKGVVHGDIKPANVLMPDESIAKLSDFGVANVRSKPNTPVGGTPNYMAPELLRGGSADFHSDMYSLGATLFEASFGHLPLRVGDSRDFDEMLRSREHAEPAFPDDWPQDIPESWRDMLQSLLAKDPQQRPVDYVQLLDKLRALVPVALPDAGLLPRTLAWLIDNLLVFALVSLPGFVMATVYGVRLPDLHSQYPALAVFMSVAVLPIPLVGSLIQQRWATSPGKILFNIRISDIHGLQPRRTKLAVRAAFQLLPVWVVAAEGLLASLRLFRFIPVVAACAVAFFAVDIAAAWFRPRNRTLHDRLLGTRVTVDPGSAAMHNEGQV